MTLWPAPPMAFSSAGRSSLYTRTTALAPTKARSSAVMMRLGVIAWELLRVSGDQFRTQGSDGGDALG